MLASPDPVKGVNVVNYVNFSGRSARNVDGIESLYLHTQAAMQTDCATSAWRGIFMRCFRPWLLLFVLSFLVTSVRAQEAAPANENDDQVSEKTDSARQRLLARIAASRGKVRLSTQADVTAARERLDAAVEDLEKMLSRSTPENRDAWKKFLHWDLLEQQLAAEEVNPVVLIEVSKRFKRNEAGLEKYTFRKLRKAIEDYANIAYYALPSQQERLQGSFDKGLDELEHAISEYSDNTSANYAERVNRFVRYFSRRGQVPELLEAVHSQYSRPNMYNRISERLFAVGINRDVNESGPVAETILGTRIRGQQQTTGRVFAELVPNTDEAAYQIVLEGTALSDNVGYNRKFKIFTEGTTQIRVTKQATLGRWGVAVSPAKANTQTNTQIQGVSGGHGQMVNNFVLRRAQKQRAQASAIANRLAARRAAREFDRQGKKLVDEANASIRERLFYPLLRLDFFPRDARFYSTSDHVFGHRTLRNEYQLAAPDVPSPDLVDGCRDDLVAQVHESVIANFAELRLAGLQIDSDRMDEFRAEIADILPKSVNLDGALEERQKQQKGRWQMTLADTHPLRILFEKAADGKGDIVKIVMRAKEFSSEDETGQRGAKQVEVEVPYLYDPAMGMLKRQKLSIAKYDRRDRQLLQSRALSPVDIERAAIENRFTPLFDEEIDLRSLKMEGPWAKAGDLQINTFHAENGWLTIGWVLPEQGSQNVNETVD